MNDCPLTKLAWFIAATVIAGPAWAQSPDPQSLSAPPTAAHQETDVAAETAPNAPVYDPWERPNRSLFAVHKTLDRTVIGPVGRGYKAVAPKPVRRGVNNVLNNLGEPLTFVNDVLQVKPARAGKTATRFLVNSTAGVLGAFDVAARAGMPIHQEDFGQTLARYGVPAGPYVFIPVLGPSNLRDIGGGGVDTVLDPLDQIRFESDGAVRAGATVVGGASARADADDGLRRLEQSAMDEYAAYRSLHSQSRRAEIADRRTGVDDLPEFDTPLQP